jgi:vacuolar iron transporter family protein
MRRHRETHRTERVGWLRAAVLGANDGIVSTASLIIGVASAHASRSSVLVAGVAGLVAGAMSMAAGEFVSVSSQADTERADLERERRELATQPEAEHAELVKIYMSRGMDRALAEQVATQLMRKDALGVHAREELGITETLRARPLQAALASAASFAAGATVPLLTGVLSPSISASSSPGHHSYCWRSWAGWRHESAERASGSAPHASRCGVRWRWP